MSGGISITSRSRPARRAPRIGRANSFGGIASGVAAASPRRALLAVFAGVMTVQAAAHRAGARSRQSGSDDRQAGVGLPGRPLQSVRSERGPRQHADRSRDSGTGRTPARRRSRDQPRCRPGLQATIGAVYTGLGLYADAQPLLERALRPRGTSSARTTPKHWQPPMIWPTSIGIGEVRGSRTALPRHRPAADPNSGVRPPRHAEGRLRPEQSVRHAKKVEGVRTPCSRHACTTAASVREPHPDTLGSLGNLGSVYYSQGRYADAEPLAAEDLDASRRVLGEDHPRR